MNNPFEFQDICTSSQLNNDLFKNVNKIPAVNGKFQVKEKRAVPKKLDSMINMIRAATINYK